LKPEYSSGTLKPVVVVIPYCLILAGICSGIARDFEGGSDISGLYFCIVAMRLSTFLSHQKGIGINVIPTCFAI
jgi:hypothetical protein